MPVLDKLEYGDLTCTSCGAVLDERLRDSGAEWRDYSRGGGGGGGGDDDPGSGARRARCGDSIVDEGRWEGGLMPTRVGLPPPAASSSSYGGGGGGRGASSSSEEERRRLALVRGRLKRTHNMIEHMIERDRKERRAEAMLERRAREARRDRGEEEEGEGEDVVGGRDGMADWVDDRDGSTTMVQRRGGRDRDSPLWRSPSTSTSTTTTTTSMGRTRRGEEDEEDVDERLSLADAVLLYGTSDQVRRIAPNPTLGDDDGEWTEEAIEAERADLRRRRPEERYAIGNNAPPPKLLRLYAAYDVLERAALELDLEGTSSSSSSSSSSFRTAVSWLLTYASRNDGPRVRGISSGMGRGSAGGGDGATLSLSLFGPGRHRRRETGSSAYSSSPSRSECAPSSLSAATELHRLRQYASLGSALLYLSAKRAGVGRTLTEVCSAFGTYSLIDPNGDGGDADRGGGVVREPLVRPKHCSRAMQELRATLPDEISPPPLPSTTPSSSASSADSPTSDGGEGTMTRRAPVEVTPTYDGRAHGSTPSTSTSASSSPRIFEDRGGTGRGPHDAATANAEEAALVDLTTRMADVLGLPKCAVSAAAAVAVQCARDARASSAPVPTAKQRQIDKGHIRPIQKRRGGDRPARQGKDDTPEDVIAIASILLVCTAGGTMQRLARQASRDAASSSPVSYPGAQAEKAVYVVGSMSNPLDDLADDVFMSESDPSGRAKTNHIKEEETSSNNHAKKEQLETSFPWKAWNDQPSWYRDICQMERCSVIPRRTIISYYSRVVHPRRLYFLGVAGKSVAVDGTATTTSESLMRSILAAVPLMSLRNL
ncbi:hypothetical protein ACHAW5_002404 [Stephanodiscus triporus]|uniref:TFIIB-type domain-containing protein n=1 Tax=Stephanodiscus triporus TaxID=2934178 RepID=A0ABD3NZR5_9STRA